MATAPITLEKDETNSKTRFYRPELDVLRFCAACGVFVFHAFIDMDAGYWASHGQPRLIALLLTAIIRSGAYGVNLFFALSSFLITELLLRERERNGSLDVKAFYFRRILRIWPLYLFFIALAYALTFMSKEESLGREYIAGFLFVYGNWVFVFHGAPHSIAGALWTISVEEQFYLSWPQVVKRAGIETIKRVAYFLIVVATASRIFLFWRGAEAGAFWFNTFVQLDPFAMGILFAIYVHQRVLNYLKIERLLLVATGVASWVLVAYYSDITGIRAASFWGPIIGFPAVAVGSLAILAATYNAPEAGWSIFANRGLVYLGKISYGLYVYHLLGLFISSHLIRRYNGGGHHAATRLFGFVLALGLTITFATISYRVLESPFLRLKGRYARVQSRPI